MNFKAFSLAAALLLPFAATAADIEAGKAKSQICQACHGADGNGIGDPQYPLIAGQYADYLAHALQSYRSGDRQHALMSPQAAQLSDQEIANLAVYFNSRPTQLRDLHGL